MAEFLVPKIIDQLSDVALKQLGERVNLVMGVEEEVRNLSSKFSTIKDVLCDAERRRLMEENVGVWLEKLEGITYEMDDVLDEWNIKILDQGMPTFFEKVCSFIPFLFSCLKQVSVRSDIALKIKAINDKLELALKEANQFNFVTSRSGRFFYSNEFKRHMTTSVFDESEMHGRKSDKDSLLKHLMPESSSKEVGKDGIKVISVIGVGGSGKTTLAQMLYNDDRVKNDFQLRKWVCVSDPFDEKRIASALLEGSETSDPNLRELESLFQRVKESFSRKKFLLVLDDVWTEDNSKWKPFRDCLKDGASGSIILVTTRSERVARAVGTNYQHPLGLISNSDCWLILKRIALSERSELCERVEKTGWKIAEKCKGLPLAAKTMGGLLQFKDAVQEWQEVLDSKIWQMEEASINLFPHFYLSYNELSPQLKRCFSYCAVFPKDTLIDVDELIRLWMAQGYLGTSRRGDERMEMKGLEYFKNLAMRSFFQELKIDDEESKIVSCKMHDIVHDFAQFLTKNECCIIDKVDYERVNGENSSKVRARHVTLWQGTIGTLISSLVLDSGRLRSLFMVDFDGELLKDLFSSLNCVRALNLSRALNLFRDGLKEVPREVGNLIHLRYLNLSFNWNLKELPEAICKLYYLETLDISFCKNLSSLPQSIGELAHLRHLINIDTVKSQEQMPQGFGKLTSLRTLEEFNVGGSYSDIVLLKYLNQLEELRIRVHGKVDFGNAQLGKKIYIQKFWLAFVGDDMENSSWTEVMELEPPPNLKFLHLKGYQGPQLPKWIVCESLINNLKILRLWDPMNISSLPCLWKLSSLEYIYLYNIQSLKHLGCEFFGLPKKNFDVEAVAFPSLKRLVFHFLLNWETWEDLISSEDDEGDEEKTNAATISVMPRLQELIIDRCHRLKVLPHRILGKTSKLKLLKVNYCDILSKRYSDKTGEEWMKISHIPQVVI